MALNDILQHVLVEIQICFTTYKFIKNAWLSQGRWGGRSNPPLHTNTTPTVIIYSYVLQKPPFCNDNGYKV